MSGIIERRAVRALVVAPVRAILLAQMRMDGRTFWCTPGGGIQPDEDIIDALQRELAEEIGEGPWNIGREIWARSHHFVAEGETYHQHERFFLVRTPRFEPPTRMNDDEEQQYFCRYEWWTPETIHQSGDAFEPANVAEILANLRLG